MGFYLALGTRCLVRRLTKPMPVHKHLFLWAHPRSISTAMEVYFRARGDYQVIHEPFGDTYWKGTAPEPVYQEILEQSKSKNKPIFIKDIAHHVPKSILTKPELLKDFAHAIVLRSPLAAFHSHLKVNPEVKPHEFGFVSLRKVFFQLTQATGIQPSILLADNLVRKPEKTIQAFCQSLDIPHIKEALEWQPEQQSDWRAGHKWQVRAGNSSGFERNIKVDLPPLPSELEAIYQKHKACYDELVALAK